MLTLEAELRELHAAGGLDAEALEHAVAIERRSVFSVFDELRAVLYGAVVLVITGIGLVIKQNLDRIGPVTLIIALAAVAGACYVPAIRARMRAQERSIVADYLLLLGALILSADLGYTEAQFHLLGANWSRQLLILAVFHGFTAYALDSRLVFSVALSAFAGWVGIERGPANYAPWEFAAPAIGLRAVGCAIILMGWREVDVRRHAGRFAIVLEHFATNLAYWGVLGWCSNESWRPLGFVALLLLAAIVLFKALRTGAEAFAVYGVCYTALGLILVIVPLVPSSLIVFSASVVLAIIAAAGVALRFLHDRFREESA